MAKIYTKVGDKGQTSLVGGQKVAKDDARLEAYGTIDELNSVLGVVRAAIEAETKSGAVSDKLAASALDGLTLLNADLEKIQHWLFNLGSLLASLPDDRVKWNLVPISPDQTRWLEERIDAATAVLKPLKNFILPGGSPSAAQLHVARTVARRAERAMVRMSADLPEQAIPFINRVSDYLFVIARYSNHLLGIGDVMWKSGA